MIKEEQLLINKEYSSFSISKEYNIPHDVIISDIDSFCNKSLTLDMHDDLKEFLINLDKEWFSVRCENGVKYYIINKIGLNILFELHKEYFLKDDILEYNLEVSGKYIKNKGELYRYLLDKFYVDSFDPELNKDKFEKFAEGFYDLCYESNCSNMWYLSQDLREIVVGCFDKMFTNKQINMIVKIYMCKVLKDFYEKESSVSKYPERKYQDYIISNFNDIFKEYQLIEKEHRLPDGQRIDILAKDIKTNKYVIIELKVSGMNPNKQLLSYGSFFDNPILIGITKNKMQKDKYLKNILYYTYNELGIHLDEGFLNGGQSNE